MADANTRAASSGIQRTLINEYMFEGNRLKPGTRIPLTHAQFRRAVQANVVHEDEKLDAEVPVNDPQGKLADEDTGSPPPAPGRGPGNRRRRNK